jgi:hypothetical protein
MIQFLVQHQFAAAVAIYWIFSAAVSTMPEPAANRSPGYLWLYRFLHTTAGNITTVFGNRIPGIKTMTTLLLMLLLSACAAHYTIHPGALNPSDSAAYDTLLIASTTIDQARMDYQDQELPADTKDALNTLIQSYTVARDAWLTYRGALATSTPPDAYLQQLTKNLSDLITAIRAFEEVKQ